jgi:ribosomal protein S6--L-glutamate ligase
VEDDARIAGIVANSIATSGYEVVWAEDGDVGLFLGTTEAFEAVILDVAFAETPGVEVLKGIRTAHPDLPVIVLTGIDDPVSTEAWLRAGASGFLAKPISVGELREIVERLVPPGGDAVEGVMGAPSPSGAYDSPPGPGRPGNGEPDLGGGTVWVVTDTRYLRQRMPVALIDWLAERSVPTRVVAADDLIVALGDGSAGRAADPWEGLAPGDVVVSRTRHPLGLALLRSSSRPGVDLLTPWEGVAWLRNKPRTALSLAQNGISTPPTFLAGTVDALKNAPSGHFPLLLKPYLGDNARGIAMVRDPAELDDLIWEDGMVLAQTFVPCGGVDTKVYVAGERIWAVRRPSPLRIQADSPLEGGDEVDATPFPEVPLTPALRRLATSCRALFGLDLLGIDVVESPHGPLVVDVNDFPNYTGVPDAPEAIGRMVLDRLRRGVRT